MNPLKTIALTATALVVAAVAPASANTISYTLFSQTTPPANSTGPAQPITSETFNLPLFNTTLGTLTGVTLALTSNVNVTAQVTNISSTQTTNYTNSTATLPFSLADSLGDNIMGSGTAGPSGPGTVGPQQTVNAATTTLPYSNSVAVASSNFGNYQTGGTGGTVGVNFAVQNVQASGNGVQGVDFFGGFGTADAAVTVTYTYTAPAPNPVPEPASIAALGAGLVGLGMVRRRKNTAA